MYDEIYLRHGKVRAGHEVRIIDIPAFTGAHGIFEELYFNTSGDECSRMLCANAQEYHGTAGKEFIKKIIEEGATAVQQIEIYIKEFKEENTLPNADGQVLRVLNRFALIAAAGSYATKLGITAWPEEDAMWASQKCFEAWLKNRGGVSAQEGNEILHQHHRFCS